MRKTPKMMETIETNEPTCLHIEPTEKACGIYKDPRSPILDWHHQPRTTASVAQIIPATRLP